MPEGLMLAVCLAVLLGPVPAQDGSPSKAAEGKPLHAFSWEEPAWGVENVTGFIWIDLNEDPRARHPKALPSEKAAEASLRKPKGCTAVFIWKGHEVLGHPEDAARAPGGGPTEFQGLWLERGTARVKDRVTRFFSEFKRAGGRLDYLVLDYEGNLSNWAMKPGQVEAILADPRSTAIKAKLGFDSAAALKDCSPPSYVLGDDLGAVVARGDKPYMKWNRLAAGIVDAAMNEAIYGPVRALYPEARASNYGSAVLGGGNVVLDTNGHLDTGFEGCFGNRGSREFYGYRQLSRRKLKDGREYGREPFDVLRWMINTMRAYRRSSPTPLSPWVSHKSWTGDNAFDFSFADNDCYQEMVYHLALLEADDFLFWNPAPWTPAQTLKGMRKESDDLLLDALLRVLNGRLGGKPRRCVTLQDIPWDSGLLVTGMKVGDRTLWRVTVPRWNAAVKVLPSGATLGTGKFLGLWHESAAGEEVSFELAK
jgi:hypothetical protein